MKVQLELEEEKITDIRRGLIIAMHLLDAPKDSADIILCNRLELIEADLRNTTPVLKPLIKKNMNYQDIITPEIAFESLGLDPAALPDVSKLPVEDQKPIVDHYIMVKVIQAINGPDFIADLSDDGQEKVVLWPDVFKDPSEPSGFGFSLNGWTITLTSTYVGSRLSFQNEEKAKHFWKYFKRYYASYMTTILN